MKGTYVPFWPSTCATTTVDARTARSTPNRHGLITRTPIPQQNGSSADRAGPHASHPGLISGDRVIAGLGSGWSTDEYNAAGADITGRGRALEETIDVCRAVWAADPVSVRGQRALIDKVTVGPKPGRQIPIMLGGGWGPRAVDRIARRADGWLAAGAPGPALKTSWDQIRETAAAQGRDADALEMIPRANIELTDAPLSADRQPFQGSMDQVIEDLVSNAEAGADELLIELQPSVRDGMELLDKALEVKERVSAAGI